MSSQAVPTKAVPPHPFNEVSQGPGRLQEFTRSFLRNRGATIGAIILLVLIASAVFAPVIAPHDPTAQHIESIAAAPSAQHLLGTDNRGRDILSRLLYGARLSLQTGVIAVGIAASAGIVLGLLSGYYGGSIDTLIMRLVDVMLAFPGILLAMTIVAVLGPNLRNAMIAIGISSIPTFTRIVRGSVLSAKEMPFELAARAIGCRDSRIMFMHILPNVLAPVIVLATLNIAGAILAATSLSFLGLGAQPPTPEWGAMLSTGRDYLRDAWWMTTFPGLAIMLTILAMNMIGDGLRDALDPRLRL